MGSSQDIRRAFSDHFTREGTKVASSATLALQNGSPTGFRAGERPQPVRPSVAEQAQAD
jgi:hypothetical protein